MTATDTSLTSDSPSPSDRPVVRINRERLWANLMRLKEIGAYDDASTGLSVRVDRIGNVYAERAGEDPRLPCVLMGSHIDTVATGGAFDGTLGVLGGIEVMRALNEAGIRTRRPIEVGFFTEEGGTVGNLALQPSQTNVIPSEAVLTVDLRNPHDDLMTAAEKHLAEFVDDLQQRHGVTATWERMAKTAMVSFHESIQDVIATSAETLGLPCVKAMSGAGHDAQEIAATCPTAMVFVAGEYGGISHTPREHSRPDACGNGIDVLANAILTLAEPVSSPAQMGPTT